ncbi:MAG: ATP-binding protein [Firmicutes bacterium]|nr:ATP-binding protein [Bacillota bacterium]
MKILTSQLLFTCFLFALYFSIRLYRKWELRYFENRLFSGLCFSSAIWSLGFWGINVQTDFHKAYLCRTFGMIGVFAMLILAQIMICYLSTLPKKVSIMFIAFSFLGIIIYIGLLPEDTVTYYMSSIGMTYSFNPGFWNNVYVIYTVIVAINWCITLVYTLFHTRFMHIRLLMRKLLLAEAFIAFGMLLDTIFPLIGKPAFPGSTIGQFVGLVVMYDAISFFNRTRININNMSKYIYSSLSLPVLVYDNKLKLQILNDAAFSFLGIESCEKNIKISSLFELEDEIVFQFDGNRKNIDTVCLHNQVDCNLAINKIINNYGDMLGYIIIVTDLSERMQAFKNLEEATREATYANQAKTTFLANMSHEIRTPMNAIIGFSELLLQMDISQEAKEHVKDIRISSQNLLAIINDILDITKIESGKMELVLEKYYLGKLLDDVTLIISQQAQKKGLDFRIKIDPAVPSRLYGDKIRIRGVLINILNNAVKYTKKGYVSFELSILEQTEKNIKLAFIISDTGIGIRQEDLSEIFKNFNRLERNIHYGVEGSGLGLAISNAYVSMMGGEIKVSSEYGKGSVFTVIIDQEVVDATAMEQEFSILRKDNQAEIEETIRVKDVNVLVVDDNHVNLRVAKGLLSSYGLTVNTADNGRDAIDMCSKNNYPIVFMDQMMPEIDGIAAMKQIRQLNSYYAPGGEGKLIVLTADAIRGVREHLLAEGFDEYLGKPMNLKQLERLLVQFLPADKIIKKETLLSNDAAYDEEVKEISHLQETLPSVNIKKGIELSGNSIQTYLQVLKINYSYAEKNLLEIKNFLEDKDYENYTIKIHSMKSTLKGIGAESLSEKAFAQEMAGKEKRYSYIDENYEAFRVQYLQLFKDIEKVLSYYHLIQKKTDEDSPLLEESIMKGILSNIRTKLDEFEFAEIFDTLEKIDQYRKNEKQEKFFEQLRVLMDDLNVEEIYLLLDNYENSQ